MPKQSNDVLNFLRRAHRMIDDIQQEEGQRDGTADTEAAARLHEVAETTIELLAGSEVACATHVFGSVALARVMRICTDAQRSALAAPLLDTPDPLALVRRHPSNPAPATHPHWTVVARGSVQALSCSTPTVVCL